MNAKRVASAMPLKAEVRKASSEAYQDHQFLAVCITGFIESGVSGLV